MEKKKISLKEIGLTRLAIMFAAGLLVIILSVPGVLQGSKNTKDSTLDSNSEVVQKDTNTTSYDPNTYISEMEDKLENILQKVSGIGTVEVMITIKSSSELVPLKDNSSTQESLDEDDGEGGSRTNINVTREESTILVTDENGNSVPYIIQELEPEVEGVVVIAEGGDDAKIMMDICETAEALFGVPAHKVKVMKMAGVNY